MRLGLQPCQLAVGSQASRLYGAFIANERHRHRYEFNNAYRAAFEGAGYVFSGVSPDGKLIELVEVPAHPFFLACQFHPEFQSKPNHPHPLFKGFIAAALAKLHHPPPV
jgi:CTP synthase